MDPCPSLIIQESEGGNNVFTDWRQKTAATHITQRDIDQVRQHQRRVPTGHHQVVSQTQAGSHVVQIESPNKNMSDQWQHFHKTNGQQRSNEKIILLSEDIEKGKQIFKIKDKA